MVPSVTAASPPGSGQIASPAAGSPNVLNGHAVAAVLTQASSRVCPASTRCVYVADGIGGVQVYSGDSRIATIPIRTTSSDPLTCPVGAYYWFGAILVTDPCGHNNLGELRVLNPATNAWEMPVRIAGPDPTFMIGDPANGDLYISNFGSGEVTILKSLDRVAKTVVACAQYPEFLDYDSASGIVFVGNQGVNSPACVDRISGTTALSAITRAGQYVFSSIDSFTGVTVN